MPRVYVSKPLVGDPPCDLPDEYGSRCRHYRYCSRTGHECAAILWWYDDTWRTADDRKNDAEMAAMRPRTMQEMV